MLYLGDLGDGSHLQTWGKFRVLGEDALGFGGGGADEFLSREKDGPSGRGCREEEGEDTLTYL